MKLQPEQIKLLGLSRKEVRVLDAVWAGQDTPLLISRATKVSRPAVYEILDRFKKRGLIKTTIHDGKHYWSPAKPRDLEEVLYSTKKALFNIEDGVEEVHGLSDSTAILHRGGDAIRALMHTIFKENRDHRLFGIQGDVVDIGWNKIFGLESTNEINRQIKKNKIIVEALLPCGWFERQVAVFGEEWARHFEGRMSVAREIDEGYFKHGGQIFIFKHSLYLMAMKEELIIEVRNSEIQKLILSMFRFMQDHSKKIDVNEVLRGLIERANGQDETARAINSQ